MQKGGNLTSGPQTRKDLSAERVPQGQAGWVQGVLIDTIYGRAIFKEVMKKCDINELPFATRGLGMEQFLKSNYKYILE